MMEEHMEAPDLSISEVVDIVSENTQLRHNLAEFLDACQPKLEYDPSPLDWLSAILTEFFTVYDESKDDDPGSMREAHHHACQLLADLRAAVAKATANKIQL
jgi:hypothetical protein